MSLKVMSWVFYHSAAEGSDRLVLLAMADHADDELLECWPSIERLALKARVSERTVQRCLKTLEEHGHIEVVRARGRLNHYRIVVPTKGRQIGATPDLSPVTPVSSGNDNQGQKVTTTVSSKPSLEPSRTAGGDDDPSESSPPLDKKRALELIREGKQKLKKAAS